MTDLPSNAAQRLLGSSDIAISPIAWGMWRLAENGRDAVDRATATEYDAVLMDIHMPELDGLEAASILRQQSLDMPIIAVSADALSESKAAAVDAVELGTPSLGTPSSGATRGADPKDRAVMNEGMEPRLTAVSTEGMESSSSRTPRARLGRLSGR